MNKLLLNAPVTMETPISEAQELMLKLIIKAGTKGFDAVSVVQDLRDHRDLWRGVVMGRPTYTGGWCMLVSLRDLAEDLWSCDTMHILASNNDNGALQSLAKTWMPNALTWILGPRAETMLGTGHEPELKILELWWD